jgi:Pyruvate/2-oxoacid:ferredoxin oxidoreductase delta subunit
MTFIIKCTLSEENNQLYGQRDYCAEPITHKDMTKYPDPERVPKPTVDAPKECDCSQCPANNPPRTIEESEAEQQINFEDHLHNYVYVKYGSKFG